MIDVAQTYINRAQGGAVYSCYIFKYNLHFQLPVHAKKNTKALGALQLCNLNQKQQKKI